MNALAERIMEEIKAHGPVTFEHFMGLALYDSEAGYYEKESSRIGKSGDFYTSVSVGPMFGYCLACFFLSRLRDLDPGREWHVVEAGAHDGQLAHDILTAIRSLNPHAAERCRFHLVEPSTTRRSWQKRRLESFFDKIEWHRELQDLGENQVRGFIYSNELLDAIPCRVYEWSKVEGKWSEMGVGYDGSKFIWSRLPNRPLADLPVLPEALTECLPEGFRIERNPKAVDWWTKAAAVLDQGFLLGFDYGFFTMDWLDPSRFRGTLRAYSEHRVSSDVLQSPGERDITANVDFDSLRQVGERVGLHTQFMETQGRFLTRLLSQEASLQGLLTPSNPALIRQWHTLTHPNQLGSSFKVLAQKT